MYKPISRAQSRLRILTILGCSIATLLCARVIFTMLIMGSSLREQADSNRTFQRPILPPRGIIFDRNHIALVANTATYQEIQGDQETVHPTLFPIDESRAFSLLLHDPGKLVQSQERTYPFGSSLAHVVGYVGFVSPSTSFPVFSLDQKIGKMGLERAFNSDLQGTMGMQEFERNATGKLTRLSHTQDSLPGKDITVSIDAVLSKEASDLLKERKGAVVVSDITTSQILVLVSSPAFDPSNIVPALTDQNMPLLNRALQAYPPGSVFKMMTALAALKSKTLTKDTLLRDEGEIKVGEANFRNWYFTSYGKTEGDINVVRALTRSNDVFFYKAAG